MLPLLMVYFAYGALGVVDISRDLWVKESLSLSPAELASVAVWFTLPWTIKVVFGELVDTVPILGSRRKVYIFIGATMTACGLLCLAGAAGGWLQQLRPDQFYVLGMMLIVLGTVVQDVVADATSTEVVERVDATAGPGPTLKFAPNSGWCRCSGGSRFPSAYFQSPAFPACCRNTSAARPCFSWLSSCPAFQ